MNAISGKSPPDAVDLWHVTAAVDAEGPVERFCGRFLDPGEVAHADRFRIASARYQHIVGRGMARVLLAGQQHPPESIRFRQLDQGKPVVDSPVELRRPFNIAHTSGLVICGVAAAPEASLAAGRPGHPPDPTSPGPVAGVAGEVHESWLGVDVESLDRRPDLGLARRYFAREEVEQIARADAEIAHELFLRIWTLKEAFIKAIGTGLRTPLDAFAFMNVWQGRPTLLFHDPDLARGRQWHCQNLQPRPGFVAAVAWGTPINNMRHQKGGNHTVFQSGALPQGVELRSSTDPASTADAGFTTEPNPSGPVPVVRMLDFQSRLG